MYYLPELLLHVDPEAWLLLRGSHAQLVQRQHLVLFLRCPDFQSTTNYDVSFQKLYRFVLDKSTNLTLNIAKVCLGFGIYKVQLPDIQIFYITLKKLTYHTL